MYRKSLEIEEALGRNEGMAIGYDNLGNFCQTRGDFDSAEEMYRKSLALFREVGDTPKVEYIEALLAELRNERQ